MISSRGALCGEQLRKDTEDDLSALNAETLCRWDIMTFWAAIFIVSIWQGFKNALCFNLQKLYPHKMEDAASG